MTEITNVVQQQVVGSVIADDVSPFALCHRTPTGFVLLKAMPINTDARIKATALVTISFIKDLLITASPSEWVLLGGCRVALRQGVVS